MSSVGASRQSSPITELTSSCLEVLSHSLFAIPDLEDQTRLREGCIRRMLAQRVDQDNADKIKDWYLLSYAWEPRCSLVMRSCSRVISCEINPSCQMGTVLPQWKTSFSTFTTWRVTAFIHEPYCWLCIWLLVLFSVSLFTFTKKERLPPRHGFSLIRRSD